MKQFQQHQVALLRTAVASNVNAGTDMNKTHYYH